MFPDNPNLGGTAEQVPGAVGGVRSRAQLGQRRHEVGGGGDVDDDDVVFHEPSVSIIPPAPKSKKSKSRPLPPWLWRAIAMSLGIRLKPSDKLVLASVLHLLTVGSAAGMMFTNVFIVGCDIGSINSRTDILDGIVSMIMVAMYCGVGVYAHRLAYRLFVHPKFLDKVRLHSKSIMKLNAAVVVLLIVATFAVVQNILLAKYAVFFDPAVPFGRNSTVTTIVNPCQRISVPIPICQSFYAFQMVFSILFTLWNVMVAVVLISVARTNTVDIRRFMCELSSDAHLHDKQFRRSFYGRDSEEYRDSLKRYVWMDDDNLAAAMRDSIDGDPRQAHQQREQPRASELRTLERVDAEEPQSNFSSRNVRLQLSEPSEREPRAKPFQGIETNECVERRIMSEQEIMFKYWKLVTSTRLASRAFQRWMCCITLTILFWSSIRVVYWLSHPPSLPGVISFILPLLLLPLLASAYAEVNYEGIKVIQSIMPTNNRILMFRYLSDMPIQMTAYAHRISYGTIGTVLAAIMAAFASKVLLQEITDVIK